MRALPDDEVMPLPWCKAGEWRGAVLIQRGRLPVGLQLRLASPTSLLAQRTQATAGCTEPGGTLTVTLTAFSAL